MRIINIHDAKTHFSKLVADVLNGVEIVIARSGKPLVKLIPYKEKLEPRKGGQLRGMLRVSDDFDDPLPKEVEDTFYQ
ncbi:MAG: hypothetical protein A3F17_05175 [Gammaproteobacteria bacterium RIFCSPHIGHO2_12_FULL_41_15]|nr:MAG: hypothetical protein A3F17_05175 [Gammaproteobacteria bacterium RIFCSPHIGHO2_12_FULL_41_15]